MATIPDPEGLTFERWSAQVYDTFPLTVPMPTVEARWKEWAAPVVSSFQVTGYTLPAPGPFSSWQAWARAFLFVYPQLGL